MRELPFVLSGTVIEGKRLGSKLGFPTANIRYDAGERDWPKEGVYAGVATVDGRSYLTILNQGKHPTSPSGMPTVEAHLLGFPYESLYGRPITLCYRCFLRPETRFPTLDALKAQLKADKEAARRWARENEPALLNEKTAPEGEKPFMEQTNLPLDIREVSYQYDAEADPAVSRVSMGIEKGSFVAVLGHNGSGKSTLAKLMNALFLPTEGQVLVCGMDTAAEEEIWNVRRHAGMVFQNPDNQIVANVVREDVAFGLENLGVPQADMPERIESALKAVRMTDFAERAPHMLSGGQKQRVAIAGVLAMEPDVMIMDEATAMLDPSGREEVLSTVRKLNREKNLTVVWITHFMEEAALADRVVVLDGGAVALEGTPKEVFSQVEKIKALGLDVPPMAELSMRLRAAGLDLPQGILTVEDMVKELKKTLCPSK